MEHLFSDTSSFSRGHTQLVEALKQAPSISCARLAAVSGIAIDGYFNDPKADRLERDDKARLRDVYGDIVNRARLVKDALVSPDEPEDMEEMIAVRPLLSLCSEHTHDQTLDSAMRDILENIKDSSSCQLDENVRVFLFRVALEIPPHEIEGETDDLAVSIVRTQLRPNHFTSIRSGLVVKPDIIYTLSFAGFED